MDDYEAKPDDAAHPTDHGLTLPTLPRAIRWMVFLSCFFVGAGIGWKSSVIDSMSPMRAWVIAVGLALFFWIPFAVIVRVEPQINRALIRSRATGRSVWVGLGIGTMAAVYYVHLIFVVRVAMFLGMTLGASCDRSFGLGWRHAVIPALCILGFTVVEYIGHGRTAASRDACQRTCEDV
ncbi:MAG: hypothetical protein IH987_11520 [Planctomycetes bacterium]|nr:hypothetical protein [Planctomycetota bacterium]